MMGRVRRRRIAVFVFASAAAVFAASTLGAERVRAAQCAPYARDISGIDLYGNAWTWWSSADGQYARGHRPALGAALVFKKSRAMPAGHVAVVTALVNDRVIKVSHANWAGKGARRGRIQKDIEVVDESPKNDWSLVRVWYSPIHDFGIKTYPVYGFIYPEELGGSNGNS
jgi:hypothetical protein